MDWTRAVYEIYECIDLMSQPVSTSVTPTNSYEYYVYAFTVSEQKSVNVELVAPGGGYRRPGGIYYIGTGDVPDPYVVYDEETGTYTETGRPPFDRVWRSVNMRYGEYDIDFNAKPGILYWVWITPSPAGSVYAVKFNIETSDKYAEPGFYADNVGPDGFCVKVMDAYGTVNGLCNIYLDGVFQGEMTIRSGSNWQDWGMSKLQAGTYTVTVEYRKSDNTWERMRHYFGNDSETEYAATIKIQGASSAGNAYFTATGDSENNTIMIDIHNANSISPSVDHYVYNINEESDAFPISEESSYVNHDFSNLLDGKWRVTVYAEFTDGNVIRIPTKARGSTYAITITFGGSGGGGGGEEINTWNIVSENLGTVDSSYVSFRYYDKYTLYRYRATFANSGYVTFYSGTGTTVDLADPIGWITEYTSTYNSDIGQPPPSALVPGKYVTDDDSGGSMQFTMSFYVTAGTEYCFWFKLKNGASTGYTYVGIEPPTGSTTAWKYNSSYFDIDNISSTQTKDVRLQSYEGALFKVTFASTGIARFSVAISGQSAEIYVTTGQYSWANDGVPLTESGGRATEISNTAYQVYADTEYYVWVKGASTSTRGTATVTITYAQKWSYNYNSNLNIRNISSVQTRRTSVSSYTGSCFLVTFATAGTATISVSGGDAYIVYVTDGYHEWDPEDGLPYKDGSGRKATGGTNVSISVTTSDSYYIWVRGSAASTTGYNITVTISIQTGTPNSVWIYVDGWMRATPWVYTSSGWRQAMPWIYTTNGWKQTT